MNNLRLKLESDGTARNTRLFDQESGREILTSHVKIDFPLSELSPNTGLVGVGLKGEIEFNSYYFDCDVQGTVEGKRYHLKGGEKWNSRYLFDDAGNSVWNATRVKWEISVGDREATMAVEWAEEPERIGADLDEGSKSERSKLVSRRSYLFIGGSSDGRILTIPSDQPHIKVHLPVRVSSLPQPTDIVAPQPLKYDLYRRETINCSWGVVVVYIKQEMSVDDAINRLIQRYAEAKQ